MYFFHIQLTLRLQPMEIQQFSIKSLISMHERAIEWQLVFDNQNYTLCTLHRLGHRMPVRDFFVYQSVRVVSSIDFARSQHLLRTSIFHFPPSAFRELSEFLVWYVHLSFHPTRVSAQMVSFYWIAHQNNLPFFHQNIRIRFVFNFSSCNLKMNKIKKMEFLEEKNCQCKFMLKRPNFKLFHNKMDDQYRMNEWMNETRLFNLSIASKVMIVCWFGVAFSRQKIWNAYKMFMLMFVH